MKKNPKLVCTVCGKYHKNMNLGPNVYLNPYGEKKEEKSAEKASN